MNIKKMTIPLRRSTAQGLRSLCGQAACVALPLALFFIGANMAAKRNGGGATPFGTACTLLALVVFIVAAGLWLSLLLATVDSGKTAKQGRPLLLLLAISLLLRLPQVGTIPFQDYAVYYGALKELCANFVLTPAYMLESMRLAAHPSYAYTLLAAIPEFFFPGNVSNMWLMQTVLSLLAVAGVYKILRATAGLKNETAFAGALLVSCCPVFLGMDSYFQLDFGSAVFFFLFLWAFLDKKMLLTVVLAGGLVLTKEFGIVLLAGFVLGALLYYLLCTAGSFAARLAAVLRDKRMVILISIGLAGGLFMVYYLFFSAKAWIDLSAVFGNEGTTRLGYIGFNADYILYKLVQLAAMNFSWLLLLLLAAGMIFGVVTKKAHALPTEAALLVYGCTAAGVLYMVFSCAMVTYTVPRYNIVLAMLLALLAAVFLPVSFGTRPGITLCAAVTILFAVQSYLTIDPVMKAIYPPVQTGTVNMAYSSFIGDHFIGDYAVYNYQYSYITKALENILDEQDYDGSADIVFLGTGTNISFGTQDRYGWDPEKKQITFMEQDAIPLHLFSTGYDNQYITDELGGAQKSKAIFVAVPESRTAQEVFAVFIENPYVQEHYTSFEEQAAGGGIGGKLYYWTAERL